jgi:hypothetical protein
MHQGHWPRALIYNSSNKDVVQILYIFWTFFRFAENVNEYSQKFTDCYFHKSRLSDGWTLKNLDEFLYVISTFIFRFVRKFGTSALRAELLGFWKDQHSTDRASLCVGRRIKSHSVILTWNRMLISECKERLGKNYIWRHTVYHF